MDAILGQYLTFYLARNLAAILAFHLADSEILAILWYFDLSLNHDQRFAMDAILGQYLAFDLARNLAAILAFHPHKDHGNPVVF